MSSLNLRVAGGCVATVLVLALTISVARAHHSFAAYNMDVTKVFTGVVTRVNPDANHLQIFFAPMNDERKNVLRDGENKPVIWAVEMGGSAQMAREGVTVASFPPGTIFSVGLHPCATASPPALAAPTAPCTSVRRERRRRPASTATPFRGRS